MTVVLDPGVLLNLAASEILQDLSGVVRLCISSYQGAKPVGLMVSGKLRILQFGEIPGSSALTVAPPGDEIEDTFLVDYVVRLTAGEAAAAALAERHGWQIATDEIKVRESFCARVQPPNRIISTVGLLQHWCRLAKPKPPHVRVVVCAIRDRALFSPKPDSDDAVWWRAALNEETTAVRGS